VTGVLASVVAWLAVAIGLIVALNIANRIVVRRRELQERRLRPRAELSIAEYLAGSAAPPDIAGKGERAVMLKVAIEAIYDLRGTERARLVELLEQRGFVADAMSGLRARRRALRLRAAETLAVIGSAVAVPALTAGLNDRDALVRTTCARTLAEVGGDDVTDSAVATAERDMVAAPGAAAAVVLALGIGRPSALAPLLRRGAAPEARLVAIAVAGVLRLSEHAPLLQACLADRDDLAAAAARGLGLIGEVRSVGALMALASDEDRGPLARAAAVTALGTIGDLSALPVLESQLRAPDWSLRAATAEALSRLGEPGAAALRAAGPSHSDPGVPAGAASQP
jgi:HEAT repeat protein